MEYREILEFWFKETPPEKRFVKDPAFDALIKKRFEHIYWSILKGETEDWRRTPEGRLAEIIVLDQFARNMFRSTAQAFAGDDLALSLAEEALSVGADKKVEQKYTVFFYMPYMHSESQEVHKKAVQIFTEYGDADALEYEMKHKAIIDQFGRYPHRNTALKRISTPEEVAWLEQGGGF